MKLSRRSKLPEANFGKSITESYESYQRQRTIEMRDELDKLFMAAKRKKGGKKKC